MNDLNQVLFEGRLTFDPKAKRLESGALFCSFHIASNSYYLDKKTGNRIENTTYMLVETWGNVAEICAKNLNKGDTVRVAGQLRQSQWEKEGRIKMEKTYIFAEHVDFKFKAKATAPGTKEENLLQIESVKATEEQPDEKEQEEIEEEIVKESEE